MVVVFYVQGRALNVVSPLYLSMNQKEVLGKINCPGGSHLTFSHCYPSRLLSLRFLSNFSILLSELIKVDGGASRVLDIWVKKRARNAYFSLLFLSKITVETHFMNSSSAKLTFSNVEESFKKNGIFLVYFPGIFHGVSPRVLSQRIGLHSLSQNNPFSSTLLNEMHPPYLKR